MYQYYEVTSNLLSFPNSQSKYFPLKDHEKALNFARQHSKENENRVVVDLITVLNPGNIQSQGEAFYINGQRQW